MSHGTPLPGLLEIAPDLHGQELAISEQYPEKLSQLVLTSVEGVTHFLGGPLDLGESMNVWLSPIEVDDGENFSYFQALYVNCRPEQALYDPTLPVTLLDVDEASFKLIALDHPGFKQLQRQFGSKDPHILIRYCNTGMAYYPRSVVPQYNDATMFPHLEKLVEALGINEPEVSVSLKKPYNTKQKIIRTELIDTLHARTYPFGESEVFSYGILLENDPWKYYEVFSPQPLEEIRPEMVHVRIDSGCDIGQIYNDAGCDCREQLHNALYAMQANNAGLVVHVPSQDGRGYGAATKMETEGLKRGIPVRFNTGDSSPLDTIAAAEVLFGTEFDIRTYGGVGVILGQLGVRSVVLETDNRLKAEGLLKAGIDVLRRPTNTTGGNGSASHVHAKHRHTAIYFGDGTTN